MGQTTTPYRLVRGLKSAYNATTYANDVYFATDKQEIWLGGKVYGLSEDVAALINNALKDAKLEQDNNSAVFTFTRTDGTKFNVGIGLTDSKLAGLLSPTEKTQIAKSIKTGSVSKNVITLTANDGTTVTLTLPAATTSAAGVMSSDMVTKLNQAGTDITTLKTFMNTKGKANGLASLDASGKVPAEQLPGFVDEIAYFLGPKSSVTNPTAVTPRTDTIATAAAADSVVYVVHNVTSGSTTAIKPTFCLKKGEYYYQKWTVPTSVSDLFQDWTYYMTSDFSPRNNVLFVRIDSTDATASGGVYRYGGGTSLVEISAQINVINNLTSTSTTSALSAAQGKALNDKVLTAISGATFTSPGTFKFTNIAGTVVLNATIPDATTSTKGLMTTTHVSTLNASVKNVTSNVSATDVTFTITKNNNTTTTFGIVGATSSTAGLMTPTDKTTLSNVVNKANANATAITTLQQQNCWYEA